MLIRIVEKWVCVELKALYLSTTPLIVHNHILSSSFEGAVACINCDLIEIYTAIV